jgi:hypothetical protein
MRSTEGFIQQTLYSSPLALILISTMDLAIIFIVALIALVVGLFTYCLYLTKGEEADSRPPSCWMFTPEPRAKCTPTGQTPGEAQRQKEMPMSDEIKKPEEITDAPVLCDTDLEQVAGGKVNVQDIHFTHEYDKSSSVLQTKQSTPAQPTTPPAK